MENMEHSGLLYPNVELRNLDGEIIFAMKRKDNYGALYYIFERHNDLMSPEDKEHFEEAWEVITRGAAFMGIPLYDSDELMQGLAARSKRLLESKAGRRAMKKADRTGEIVLIKDIQVKVFNHATEKINSLTVGISAPPGASKILDKI